MMMDCFHIVPIKPSFYNAILKKWKKLLILILQTTRCLRLNIMLASEAIN